MKSKIETSYGNTDIYTAAPLEQSVGNVVVVPGYSEEGAVHFKDMTDAVAQQGYTAVTFNQPRRNGDAADPLERQSRILLDVLNSTLPNQEVHGVAHSLGAAALLKAVRENPNKFKSIMLFQPAGMTGEQSLLEIAGRVGKKVTNNQLNAGKGHVPGKPTKDGYTPLSIDSESATQLSTRVAHAQLTGGKVLARNPILALREANAARKYDISEDLAAVKGLGMPIQVVQSHGDELYDTAVFNEEATRKSDAITSLSTPANRNAGHDHPWIQPETTARVVDDLIRQAKATANLHEEEEASAR